MQDDVGESLMNSWATPPEYLSILPRIRVLLMGSFHPNFLPRLESIKKGLIQSGIANCRITRDFDFPDRLPDEPEDSYNLRKSEYWIRRADVFIFVFFDGVDNSSVAIELNTTLSTMPGNAWRTILAYQENVPSLVSGLGIRFQPEISVIAFSSDLELQQQIVGNIIRLLERFYLSVYNRPDGEWEYSSVL